MLIALGVQLFSLVVYAKEESAVLLLPEDFDVEMVNGKKFRQPLFQRSKVRNVPLQVERSIQSVLLKYSQVYEDGDDFDVIKSRPFQLRFSLPAQVSQLSVRFIKPANRHQAKIFAKNPALEIVVDVSGNENFSEADSLPVEIVFADDLLDDMKVLKSSQLSEVNVLEQLKQNWSKATAVERKAFLEFVK